MLTTLGDRQQHITASAIDEKMVLEQRRAELENFEELVFKIAVVVERVNLYTTGIIFPRDQNLNIIPFFDGSDSVVNGYINQRNAT